MLASQMLGTHTPAHTHTRARTHTHIPTLQQTQTHTHTPVCVCESNAGGRDDGRVWCANAAAASPGTGAPTGDSDLLLLYPRERDVVFVGNQFEKGRSVILWTVDCRIVWFTIPCCTSASKREE